jgi:hypothetical protein
MFRETGRGYGFPVVPSLRDLLIGDDRKFGAWRRVASFGNCT